MNSEIEKQQDASSMTHKTYETYFKIGLIGLWIALIILWIADAITENSLLEQVATQAGWGLAIATFLFCIYYKKYTKIYNRALLAALILGIFLFILGALNWQYPTALSTLWANLFNFLIITLFAYIFYWCYKLAVKDIKTPRDERNKINFSRATRNSYIFLIATIFFIPIVSIIQLISPTINAMIIVQLFFVASIIIGVISFYYYDKRGK